jgi:hypothetical protein
MMGQGGSFLPSLLIYADGLRDNSDEDGSDDDDEDDEDDEDEDGDGDDDDDDDEDDDEDDDRSDGDADGDSRQRDRNTPRTSYLPISPASNNQLPRKPKYPPLPHLISAVIESSSLPFLQITPA